MAKEPVVIKCPVCGSSLTDDICEQCGYVHLYFPTSVPKGIDEFQEKRVGALKNISARHTRQIDEAKTEMADANKEIEKLRKDRIASNDKIKNLNETFDKSNRQQTNRIQQLEDQLKSVKATLNVKENELNKKEKALQNAETKAQTIKLPFAFSVSEEKDFIGNFDESGERTGLGVSKNLNGTTYLGDWRHGLKTGIGVETDRNGRKYAGQFRMNRAHGVGVAVNPDGSYFAGEWKGGKRKGGGMTVKPNGEKMIASYEGDIEDNALGAYLMQDGSVVCGRMMEDGPTGKCIRYLLNGSIEEEIWRNGVKIQ